MPRSLFGEAAATAGSGLEAVITMATLCEMSLTSTAIRYARLITEHVAVCTFDEPQSPLLHHVADNPGRSETSLGSRRVTVFLRQHSLSNSRATVPTFKLRGQKLTGKLL
jgi:hypothetical protein